MTALRKEMPCELERHGQGIETTHVKHLATAPEYSTRVFKKATFRPENRQVIGIRVLHCPTRSDYHADVAAKSVARFGDRHRQRRTGAHTQDDGAFFVPAHLRYGGGAWETFGSAGSFVPGSPTRVSAASHCLATVMAVPSDKGTDPMKHPLSLLHERRADSHRAMAIAALRSKSSLNVRRDRYNRHMDKARAAQALARQYQKTPRADHGDARTTALSLIEPRLNAWRDDPEPAEGRELIGLICMASALGAIDLDDQARIVTQFQPSQPEARHA